MIKNLSSLLEHKKVLFVTGTVLLIYSWSFFGRRSYLSFLLGVFTTLGVEAFIFWNYLAARIQQQTGGRITVELAKIEVKKMMSDEINMQAVETKITKKKYYENNKSKPLIGIDLADPVSKPEPKKEVNNAPQPDKTSPVAENINAEPNPSFSHKEINELLKMKEKDQQKDKVENKVDKETKKVVLEEKVVLSKLGRKLYLGQAHDLMHILNLIGESEKVYGKSIQSFEFKYGLTLAEESPLVKREEQPQDLYKIRSLSEKEKNFLRGKFGELTNKKYLYLPEWKKLKQTINFIGQVHSNCSKYIFKVSVPAMNTMTAEYEEKYEAVKAEKVRLTKEYDEAHLNYTKLKGEYDALHKTLEASVAEYQAKYKMKKGDEVVLKHEMKARLIKSQIDSLTNKLSVAEDKLNETRRHIEEENEKITVFIQVQNEKKEHTCQKILKNVIQTFETNLSDMERSFEVLIQLENNPYSITDKGFDIDNEQSKGEEKKEDTSPIKQLQKVTIGRISEAFENSQKKIKKRLTSGLTSTIKLQESGEENKLVKLLEDFKITIEDLDITYNEDLFMYTEETKKSKDFIYMLKSLSEYEDLYNKERDKLVSFNFSNFKVNALVTFWKMIQSNIYLVNRLNSQLHEKLVGCEKVYAEFLKTIEKDFKASDLIIQNAFKKATTYVKNMEKDLLKREHGEKKGVLSKFFTSETKESPFNEDAVAIEKCTFLGEVEKGLSQIADIISKFQKESITLKKDIMLSYLQCYSGQHELFSNLANDCGRISPVNAPEEIKENKELPKPNEKKEEEDIPKAEEKTKEKLAENNPIVEEHKSSDDHKPAIPQQQDQHGQQQTHQAQIIQPTKEVLTEHKEEERQGPENLIWFNQMLKVFLLEWTKNTYFKEKMMKIFFRSFNKKPSKFVRRIKIKDLVLDPKFFDIRSVTPLPSDTFEFLYDIHLVYQGNTMMEIETRLEPSTITYIFTGDQPVPLTAKVLFKSLNGKIRFCWVPSEYGRSWYSFVGQPILDLVVEPKIGASQFDIRVIPHAKTLITDLINKKIRKMTFPYRKEIDLPMASPSLKINPPPE